MQRRRYRPLYPKSLGSGVLQGITTPDAFTLTTELYLKFWMRNSSWTGGGATAHQWSHGTVEGNRSWIYSIHSNGLPRLAVYPAGTVASLIGPQAINPFPYEPNTGAWVAAYANLDIGGGNREFHYWHSRTGIGNPVDYPQYWDDMGGPIVEAGATSFFDSTDTIKNIGNVATEVTQYGYMEIRERPTGPILVRAEIPWWPATSGPLVPGPDTLTDRYGRVWTFGVADHMERSKNPRPFAA